MFAETEQESVGALTQRPLRSRTALPLNFPSENALSCRAMNHRPYDISTKLCSINSDLTIPYFMLFYTQSKSQA